MKHKHHLRFFCVLLAGLMLAGCNAGNSEQTLDTTVGGETAETTQNPDAGNTTSAGETTIEPAGTDSDPASSTTSATDPDPGTSSTTSVTDPDPGTSSTTTAGTDPVPGTSSSTSSVTDPDPGKPESIIMDIYGDGYNTNMIVGFDEYGRSFTAASAERENREVGIFYFLWLGQHGTPDIYDISLLLRQYGSDLVFHQDDPLSPASAFHWWEKPLYGYYNSSDEWVIRRHMEMLTDAGVDFLVFDVTNTFTYQSVAERVMKVISELRAEGWDAPQVTFYTHSRSIQTIQYLYDTIYATNTYPESWYRVNGKPMMIGYTTAKKDLKEAADRGDTSYNPGDLPQELCDFFYMREARWPYDPVVQNGWPYTEWKYPQPLNTDMVSVSIASHPGVPFSFSLTHQGWMNWGRGYDVKKKVNVHDDIYKGTFFAAQWERALSLDPRFVFVTGWNEWVSQKNWYGGEYTYTDNVDMEYSRDAEPMKGGYEDAYYIQMMYYIRQYKYKSIDGLTAQTVSKTIDVNGAASQWNDVNAVYRRVGTDDGSRDSYGGAATVYYKQQAVTNNILEVRVTADAQNLYFYIKTAENIKTTGQSNWMNLFIGTGSAPTQKGWESYEFVINRSRNANTASIESLNADYTGKTLRQTAVFSVQGNVMQISVPRAALGLESAGDFYFKVADGVSDPAEIMDYYCTGRSLPMGRLSYLYQIGEGN